VTERGPQRRAAQLLDELAPPRPWIAPQLRIVGAWRDRSCRRGSDVNSDGLPLFFD
jgi:hypothetical protein